MKKYLALLSIFLVTGTANAALISVGESLSPVVIVDRSTATRSLTVADSGAITDVNVFIDFTKCDNPILSDGTCAGTGFSYNNEIVFILTSPTGTVVNLITAGTYSGSTPGTRAEILLDSDVITLVGGPTVVSGTFAPIGHLADFNGEDALGSWTLTFRDTVGRDPMSLNAWRLDITTADVPEPASLALLGLGLVGIGFARKQKKA